MLEMVRAVRLAGYKTTFGWSHAVVLKIVTFSRASSAVGHANMDGSGMYCPLGHWSLYRRRRRRRGLLLHTFCEPNERSEPIVPRKISRRTYYDTFM